MIHIWLFVFRVLFLLLAAPIFSSLYAEDIITPSNLVRLSLKQGTYHVEGYVAGHIVCPPCPAGALCKPCPPKAFFLADKIKAQAISSGVDLPNDIIMVRCNNPERFEFGKKYQIALEISELHASRYKHEGFELKETQ